MVGPNVDDNVDGQTPQLKLDTTPALTSINYNEIVAQDRGTSSEDESTEAQKIAIEDARSAIGVSISREQTRLTSPKTPAIEKAAAIERAGGFFAGADGTHDTLVEEPEEEELEEHGDAEAVKDDATRTKEEDLPVQRRVPQPSPRRTSVRLPSPWRVDPKPRWQTGTPVKGRGGLFDGIFNRRRASSGPESSSESWQKTILSSLPSLPKPFLPASSSQDARPGAVLDRTSDSSSQTRSKSVQPHSSVSQDLRGAPDAGTKQLQALRSPPATSRPSYFQPSQGSAQERAKVLRRSTSDHSLTTLRTLSTAESLGDDSRFEDVSAQVNSRLKAIKDSWQDASIKMPSFPSISVASFTPDFLRERSGSLNKRQSIAGPLSETSRDLRNGSNPPPPIDPMTRQRYNSAKAAVGDAVNNKSTTHPHFNRALEQLEGDIVILGGYRGSILRSAEPPHRQVWVPVKVGLNLRKVNLEVGFEEGDDGRASESVTAGGMLTHIGPVDISRRLFKRLRSCRHSRSGKLRVHDYGYDWRLDPVYLSQQLIKFLEALPCNKPLTSRGKRGAIVVAHSLGGLITRHAVNQRPELFRGVVYAGVPTTCVNILGPMRNGDEVLLSERVLTAQVNFSIRTSFALLPLDGRCFFDKETRQEYPVDFFDPQTWVNYRLSPCVARPLPPLGPPQKSGGISGYVTSMASALPSLPGRSRKSSLRSKVDASGITAAGAAEPDMAANDTRESDKTMTNGNYDDEETETSTSIRTAVTIPREKAMEYLTRTLASVKKFKEELDFVPSHTASNAYPPLAVIYGKSTPTVYGAKVDGREGIKHADAYDELAFASGDGVVLARAAMVPQGYTTARGGVVSSERGHVTLLSDLEAVGKCLNAVLAARGKGVGCGN